MSRKDDADILSVKVLKREVPVYFNPVARRIKGSYILGDTLAVAENFNSEYSLKDNQIRVSDIPYSDRPTIAHSLIDGAVVDFEDTINFVCNDTISEYSKGHSCIAFFSRIESVEKYAETLK